MDLAVFKMAGVKGRSGTNRDKDKPWSDAIRRAALQEETKGIPKLLKIAEACVAAAMEGDMAAIKEIGDRLDGRPAQETNMTIEKRDATDWTLTELVALIHNTRADRGRDPAPGGSAAEPDQLH